MKSSERLERRIQGNMKTVKGLLQSIMIAVYTVAFVPRFVLQVL